MKVKESVHALKLSLLPAVLASSCCLTIPALGLLGLSFAEQFFADKVLELRLLAVVILVLSLIIYFYKKGITTKKDLITNRKTIILISLQTAIFALMFYLLFLYIFVPILCTITELGSCIAL